MSNNYDQLKYEFWKGFVEYANSDAEFAKKSRLESLTSSPGMIYPWAYLPIISA